MRHAQVHVRRRCGERQRAAPRGEVRHVLAPYTGPATAHGRFRSTRSVGRSNEARVRLQRAMRLMSPADR